jgi:signal transduction histidine kinase
MPAFIAFLAYLIVKFKSFDIKLIGPQVLVWALVILIGSEFFFVENMTNQILVAITLVLSAIASLIIVRSVKKEIAQKELLEIANNDKSEFVSFASHQIRTPLTSIKGYSANILDGDYGPLTPELKDAIQKILVRGTDAVTLISQYLDKSKMELGQLKYDFVDFDLIEMAKQVTKGFEPNAEQAKLTLKFSTDGASSYIVNADKGKIKETIGNLIDNAIKYTPSGSIEVSVYKKDDKVLVKFADTGIGMSQAVIADLYKKFGRAKDAAKTNILGNGLGLFLAKTFMEAMKGRTWAESSGDGKGSQFYMELPLKMEEAKTTIQS